MLTDEDKQEMKNIVVRSIQDGFQEVVIPTMDSLELDLTHKNKSFKKEVNQRFDEVDQRFNIVENRLESLDRKVDLFTGKVTILRVSQLSLRA